MQKLTRQDLFSLEEYAEQRSAFRAEVLAHKKNRRLALGDDTVLYFEDRLTIQYQVQEMLRIERIFEAAGIEEELAAYNPLIPDGANWKATFMLEFPQADERHEALSRLIGIEDRVWVQVADYDRVYAIADEDMERETTEKTSSVHFMRFELTAAMISSLQGGAELAAGIDHAGYNAEVLPVPVSIRTALLADLD